MSTYVDIHIIQNLPPSCVNRDDTGTPKTAIYGGVRRLRVSSQSWKHATRKYFADHLAASEVGVRTKRVVELLAREIAKLAPEFAEESITLAESLFKDGAKIKIAPPRNKEGAPQESTYLLFLSNSQLRRLAEITIQAKRNDEKFDSKTIKKILKEDHAVDIALFGRMVADDTDLNVDAACQVAHAISTHASENEFDFFTAVDDEKSRAADEDAGAGMLGTIEFSSATIYRYATINVDLLRENLGTNDATLKAIDQFIRGFSISMPTGKSNSFANHTLPEAICVSVRDDQPLSFVGAFEKAIPSNPDLGYLDRSVERLASHARNIETAYGTGALGNFVVSISDSQAVDSLGTKVSFSELPTRVKETVTSRLPIEELD
ncbi:type I-E CRISPR-associated protein Cas7/Cse4/CasC [Schaalia sp. ZJ1691]|uniref:type I-E CRISPR-associated protein Cas7/Cse4/CasC n=1 Tax=Schaalia sp. ZJ1691 TaxID=2709404 RepID=UPI0013EA2A35|nr:type I-E CRISPR-associated protein Cas7/Cse4/CasC [Schaalia sp. ZJ1691]